MTSSFGFDAVDLRGNVQVVVLAQCVNPAASVIVRWQSVSCETATSLYAKPTTTTDPDLISILELGPLFLVSILASFFIQTSVRVTKEPQLFLAFK